MLKYVHLVYAYICKCTWDGNKSITGHFPANLAE